MLLLVEVNNYFPPGLGTEDYARSIAAHLINVPSVKGVRVYIAENEATLPFALVKVAAEKGEHVGPEIDQLFDSK